MTTSRDPKIAPSEIITLPIDEIQPYWRNPREVSEEAITKVAESIERFGYQTPIVVDSSHVIIAGHTRYAALRKIGVIEVPVIVSALPKKKANEYRIIDNKSAEYTSWDEDRLMLELREVSAQVIENYFPDLDLGSSFEALAEVTEEDVEEALTSINAQRGLPTIEGATITCLHCYHPFEVPKERILALADEIRAEG